MNSTIFQDSVPENLNWSSYEIDNAGYDIFLQLQQNPTMNNNSISKELGYSTTLVNSRLNQLKSKGFLRPDKKIIVPLLGHRMQTELEAIYEPYKLGLSRYHVYLENIPTFQSLKKIEKLLAIHPYSHYHVASFNGLGSLYCQFDIPYKSEQILNSLLKTLQQDGLIEKSVGIIQKYHSNSNFDFKKWEFRTNKWKLYESYKLTETSFETEIDLLWHHFMSSGEQIEHHEELPEFIFNFDHVDMKLLRELTVNSKVNISELAKFYEISRSRLSRRINRLRELVIKDHKLYFDQSVFDLSYPQIIKGKFKNNSEFRSDTFSSFLELDHLPFSTSLSSNGKEFVWFTLAPPSVIPALSRFVWQRADEVSVYQLDINTSRSYYFYHLNLHSKKEWKSSKEYMVDQPLDSWNKIK